LATNIHAGVQNIEDELDCPDATQEDLSVLSATDLALRNYVRLPQTLPEALEKFTGDKTLTGWFPDRFADVFVMHQLGEIAFLKDKSEAEICAA